MSVEWGTPSGDIPSIRAWLSKNLDAEKFAFIDQFLRAAEKEHALSTIIDALEQAHSTITALSLENEQLHAELAAAQKDAAMFLWLADAEPFSARWQIVRLEWWRGRDGWSDVRGDALRLAIAAAMAQEKHDE